jgi:hypothetical protein
MGRVFSFGLDRVLEQIVLTSVGARRKTPPQGDSADGVLPTGQRRILEHVAMMSVEKRLRMPH